MVILDIKLDNLYAFKNFHMNLTYPKKIVGSCIKEEHLANRQNFRYKKVNIIMGANASGKTTLGRALMKIFNFIVRKNYETITQIIYDNTKMASFVLDMVCESNILYRITCHISPACEKDYSSDNVIVKIQKETIRVNDSYESCIKRLQETECSPDSNYINELEKMPKLDWMFRYPDIKEYSLHFKNDDKLFPLVLQKVLKTLDVSIQKIEKSKDVDDAYVIRLKNRDIILQSGEKFNNDCLSSGTVAGVQIAEILSSLLQGTKTFFYCDEKFTYIHSDVEKAILSIMISSLKPNSQLFFTTHNTNILDLNLPKHAFTFLRKNLENDEYFIENINAASFIKRNTDSLKNAVENDLFCVSPSLDDIFDIGNLLQ